MHLQYAKHDAAQGHPATIPSIAHFVYLPRPGENGLQLRLQDFIAIYSAHLHLGNPANNYTPLILLHTPIDPATAELDASPFAKRALAIPGLRLEYATAPNATKKNIPIVHNANKSDFVRSAVLRKWGGMYMDLDSVLLRNLEPLQRAGFKAVLGEQSNGWLAPGLMLAAPGSKLMQEYHEGMDDQFDGSWNVGFAHLGDEVTRRRVSMRPGLLFYFSIPERVSPHYNTTGALNPTPGSCGEQMV